MPNLVPPPPSELFSRYVELKRYVGLTQQDIERATAAWPLVEDLVPGLVEDFYDEILKHEDARRIFDGPEQVERLKKTLRIWIADLFAGVYDEAFVARRWQVGFRHVQIGLDHIWVSAAMSRLRERLVVDLRACWGDNVDGYIEAISAIRRMMDLDLAMIQDAYHAESVAQQISHERDFAEGVIETAQAVVMVVTPYGQIIRGNAFLRQLLQSKFTGSTNESANSLGNVYHLVAESVRPALAKFISQAATEHPVKPLETELHVEGSSPRRVRWHARQLKPILVELDEPIASTASGNAMSSATMSSTTMSGPTMSSAVPMSELALNQLVLFVGQDITDLTETQRLLVRQERLAAIGQTMTGLAHESRNAFQRSQASLETLLLELEDRPAAVQLIERIQRAHDHLLHLYEEVLQFARPIRLELQSIALVNHLNQTWQYVVQGGSAGHINFTLSNHLTNDEITGDPFAVEQVFRNLLENAAQASEPSSSIEVEMQDDWIGSEPAVRIEIRDHGRGLPSEYLERVFEPFFTTRPRGTGLGLPIARRLVESHGGSLVLRPADGPGTLAELLLPRIAVPDQIPPAPSEDTRRSPA